MILLFAGLYATVYLTAADHQGGSFFLPERFFKVEYLNATDASSPTLISSAPLSHGFHHHAKHVKEKVVLLFWPMVLEFIYFSITCFTATG